MIHTDITKGAVKVVIPKLIPRICNTVDSKTEHPAHTPFFQLVPPKAMAHNTPLYHIRPAFKYVVSTSSKMARGIGRSAPKIV